MAIVNGYATLDQLKARLSIELGDTNDDATLEQNIEAASREVDGLCGRFFYSATAQTKYYATDFPDLCEVDDLVSVTTLKTDEDGDRVYETTWGATDFELEPSSGPPFTRIYVTPTGPHAFPWGRRSIQVIGTFGWAAVPDAVHEATLLVAARLFKRKETPLGFQAGNAQLGAVQVRKDDPDVVSLLAPYRKFALVGV